MPSYFVLYCIQYIIDVKYLILIMCNKIIFTHAICSYINHIASNWELCLEVTTKKLLYQMFGSGMLPSSVNVAY